MQNKYHGLLACCLLMAVSSSCGDSAKESQSQTAPIPQAHAGTWEAAGSHPLGYSHGKYSIRMEMSADASCKMMVEYHLNKTAMSDRFSDIIEMQGKWKGTGDSIELEMKVAKWVVTDNQDYKSEEEFDDFLTTIKLKQENGQMRPANFGKSINLGTTQEARDGLTLIPPPKGKGIILEDVNLKKLE